MARKKGEFNEAQLRRIAAGLDDPHKMRIVRAFLSTKDPRLKERAERYISEGFKKAEKIHPETFRKQTKKEGRMAAPKKPKKNPAVAGRKRLEAELKKLINALRTSTSPSSRRILAKRIKEIRGQMKGGTVGAPSRKEKAAAARERGAKRPSGRKKTVSKSKAMVKRKRTLPEKKDFPLRAQGDTRPAVRKTKADAADKARLAVKYGGKGTKAAKGLSKGKLGLIAAGGAAALGGLGLMQKKQTERFDKAAKAKKKSSLFDRQSAKIKEKMGAKPAVAKKAPVRKAPVSKAPVKKPVVSKKAVTVTPGKSPVKVRTFAAPRRRMKEAEGLGGSDGIQAREAAAAAFATAIAGQVPGINKTANDISGFLGKNLKPLGMAGLAAGSVYLIAKALARHRKGSGPKASTKVSRGMAALRKPVRRR